MSSPRAAAAVRERGWEKRLWCKQQEKCSSDTHPYLPSRGSECMHCTAWCWVPRYTTWPCPWGAGRAGQGRCSLQVSVPGPGATTSPSLPLLGCKTQCRFQLLGSYAGTRHLKTTTVMLCLAMLHSTVSCSAHTLSPHLNIQKKEPFFIVCFCRSC